MNFYTYGNKEKPVLLLIPGTCCHHSLFDEVTPRLTEYFYTVVVSFSGFDENEDAVYTDMTAETERIEAYLAENFGGHIKAAYGCSLGGSFVAYLVQRGKVKIEHAIIGSSDMDEAEPRTAAFQARLISGILYKMLKTGSLPGWMRKVNELKIKKHPEDADYRQKFTDSFLTPALTGGRVKRESIYNQFYSDLVTKLQTGIDREGTKIHVFYAVKMGKQYEERYRKFFASPDIRRHELQHEELLFCYPERWTQEVLRCCEMEKESK